MSGNGKLDGRTSHGKFARGNQCASTSGLWRSWSGLTENERRRCRRTSAYLEGRGFPPGAARSLAVIHFLAGKVVNDYAGKEATVRGRWDDEKGRVLLLDIHPPGAEPEPVIPLQR